MKHLFLAAALGLLLGGALTAQTDYRQAVRQLGLTDDQITQVVQTVKASQGDLERARADMKVSQAQLDRILLDENPAQADIEKQVRDRLDKEFKVETVRIARNLKVRALVGQENWGALAAMSKGVQDTLAAGKKPNLVHSDDKPPLKDLMPLLDDLD